MIRTIAAAFFSAVVVLGFVTAQTATQQQQQKTNTNTTQQTDTTTNNVSTTTSETDANSTMPVEPIVEPTVEPEPVYPEPEAETTAATPRTGEKESKLAPTSCPIHPEVKTRAAGKCPVCRLEERKLVAARAKDGNPTAQPALEPALEPAPEPTPLVSPTREPVESEPMTTETSQPIP